MAIWFQCIVFGITGFFIYLGIYYYTPKLVNKGIPLINAFWFSLWWPVLLLLPLSIAFTIFLEGLDLSLQNVVERFRLHSVSKSDWGWIAGAIVVTILFDQLLEPIGKFFAKIKWFQPPAYLPAPFNPLKKFQVPPQDFFGVKLQGNWRLLCIFVPLHLLAMFSEEMMWRGYMLPIQESMFGSFAWLINGLLWAWLVHACLKWHFIGMLPGMLVAPFVAQQTESTWASLLAHAVPN